MKRRRKACLLAVRSLRSPLTTSAALLSLVVAGSAFAFERYRNEAGADGSNCSECHGGFWDDTSTKGSVFPSDSKHEMHQAFITGCTLCHFSSGPKANPYIGESGGTDDNPGIGCIGCHTAFGLRAHHAANGITSCAGCHPDDGTPSAEGSTPPYYGTVDTLADNACNLAMVANTNENWTIGDFIGLDNDGDNLYDLADFDCGPPYRIVGLEVLGNDVQISWETVGGRKDVLQVTPNLSTNFTDAGLIITNAGVGLVTNTTVEIGGLTPTNRFYRIRSDP